MNQLKPYKETGSLVSSKCLFLRAVSKSRSVFLSQNFAKAHETMCYLRILQLNDFELIQETARAYAPALYFLNGPKIKVVES